MNQRGLLRWGTLIARFLTGQAAVQLVNLITGFLILRFLSLHEYAVYTLASLLQSVASVGSDLGVSNAVVSIGAPIREDVPAFSALLRSALRLRRRFFARELPVVVILAYVLLRGTEDRISVMVAVILLAMVTAWVQQSVTLGVSVLNTHHDSSGLTRTGVGAALCRLILVAVFCRVVPHALTALAINLAGMLLNALLLSRLCRRYVSPESRDEENFAPRLLAFARPLMPGVVYYMLQGQISLFLLGIAGATGPVAQVGALGRLGQAIGILTMVNAFFIQPYFARIGNYRDFTKRSLQTIAALLLFFGAVTASSWLFPGIWLALLGPKYGGLERELVIALAGAQLTVAGGIIFTMVIATRVTRGQWIQIPLGLGTQVAFLAANGLKSTHDALMMNLLPAVAVLALECGLLARVLSSWRRHGRVV